MLAAAPTRTQRVAAAIRDMVFSGALPPGARLQENGLAERLGVSRTPVREALSILCAEGLLEHSPNCGCVVRRITLKDVVDLFDLRATLEAMAARVAAERGVPAALRAVALADLDASEALTAGPPWSLDHEARWERLNARFHATLLDVTSNAALRDAVRQCRRFPIVHGPEGAARDTVLLRQGYGDREHCRRSHMEHRGIFDAILAREGTRAEHLMREHVYRSRDSLRRAVEGMAERRRAA